MTATTPLLVPVAVGTNVALIVHVTPMARVEGLRGQLLVWAKSPLAAMALKVKVAVPVLVTVMDLAALFVPTTWLAKESDVGEKAIAPVPPTPVKLSVWGLPEALSLTESVALLVPVAVGVKVTLMVQVWPTGTAAVQLFVGTKSPLFVPVIVTPLTVTGSVLVAALVSVTATVAPVFSG